MGPVRAVSFELSEWPNLGMLQRKAMEPKRRQRGTADTARIACMCGFNQSIIHSFVQLVNQSITATTYLL